MTDITPFRMEEIPNGHVVVPAATIAGMNAVADRLGALYQAIGRLDVDPAVQSHMLNEVLAITRALEVLSGRDEDERH